MYLSLPLLSSVRAQEPFHFCNVCNTRDLTEKFFCSICEYDECSRCNALGSKRKQRNWNNDQMLLLVEQGNELRVNCPPGKSKKGDALNCLIKTLNGHHLFSDDFLTIEQVYKLYSYFYRIYVNIFLIFNHAHIINIIKQAVSKCFNQNPVMKETASRKKSAGK